MLQELHYYHYYTLRRPNRAPPLLTHAHLARAPPSPTASTAPRRPNDTSPPRSPRTHTTQARLYTHTHTHARRLCRYHHLPSARHRRAAIHRPPATIPRTLERRHLPLHRPSPSPAAALVPATNAYAYNEFISPSCIQGGRARARAHGHTRTHPHTYARTNFYTTVPHSRGRYRHRVTSAKGRSSIRLQCVRAVSTLI